MVALASAVYLAFLLLSSHTSALLHPLPSIFFPISSLFQYCVCLALVKLHGKIPHLR